MSQEASLEYLHDVIDGVMSGTVSCLEPHDGGVKNDDSESKQASVEVEQISSGSITRPANVSAIARSDLAVASQAMQAIAEAS